MSDNSEYNQFVIAHQLKRRIRIIAPSLFKDKERCYILDILLSKREAIEKVKITPQINSVTISFDSDRLPVNNLFNLLEIVLSNFSQKPSESIKKIAVNRLKEGAEKQDIVFGIGDMSCASCALYLEMVLSREVEIDSANINYISETGSVSGYLDKAAIFKIIEKHGYRAYSIDTLAERKILLEYEQKHLSYVKKKVSLISLLGVPMMLADFFFARSRALILFQAAISLPAVFWGGKEVFSKALVQAKNGSYNMDSLIAVGAGSAIIMSVPALFQPNRHSYFNAATAIIGFVQLGRFLEEFAKTKMIGEVDELVKIQPQFATLMNGNDEVQVNIDQVNIGDVLLIRPGERIPVDGIVLSGLSSVDESMVTGAQTTAIKEKGHELLDGSINGSGMLKMKATAIGKDTVLAGLIHMIDQTQSSKLRIQKTVDNISAKMMPAIALLSMATFVIWVGKGERLIHALSNAISVLLISCPCALGLATPAATSVSYGNSARRKIYIRNGNAIETMAAIDTVIFDKTGTLTEGNASVSAFHNVSGFDDDYLLQLVAATEFNSEHVFAKGIVKYVKDKDIAMLESSRFRSIPDQGVMSEVDGYDVLLGNEVLLKERSIDTDSLKAYVKTQSLKGDSLIYIVVDSKLAGLFGVSDQIRRGVKQVVTRLHEEGKATWMVTGDTKNSALSVANFSGIKDILAEANPAKKIQFIRDLQSQGQVVAMIGDGINDAPALAAADVSLVVNNAAGIAIEAADFVLVDEDIAKLIEVHQISKKTLKVIKQNLFWAFVYNGLAIPVAMTGRLNPMISSAAMALSSVSVIANSLRLRN